MCYVKRSLIGFSITLACLLPSVTLAQQESVDEYIQAQMEERHVPGLAIGVLRGGSIVKAEGYGLANIEHSVPVRPNTIFQSGSLGKQFTSAAVMMLVEQGKLNLDDPINTYLDGSPDKWADITVRHLLNHTSGIQEYEESVDYTRDYTEEEFVRTVAEQPLDFAPGENWSYSNTGYVLLGILISKVAGTRWGDFVQERIFDRLGMETARIISDTDIIPNRAAGYRLDEGQLKNQEWVSPFFNSTADGALYFSVLDIAKWDMALYTEELLTEKSVNAMWSPAQLKSGKEINYGFGWVLTDFRGHRVVEHSGHWQGFAAFIARYLDDSLTVILLANQANLSPGIIAHGVAGYYEPELRPVKRTSIALAPEALDAYVGRYEFPSHLILTVAREKETLVTSWEEGEKRELLAESDGVFFYADRETLIEFVKDDQGNTTHLVLDWGVPEEAKRIE